MKLTVLLGTRPEAIKLAPVIREARAAGVSTQVVFTGQHEHLVRPLTEFFDFPIDVDLAVARPNQSLPQFSAETLHQLERHADRLLPSDWMIVQGDTTSAWIGAYWAALHRGRGVKIAHVEAGLRTYDLSAPFPEEMNRQLIGRIASVHFAPTAIAAENLRREGVAEKTIFNVGNPAIDSLLWTRERLTDPAVVAKWGLPADVREFARAGDLVLVTAHRRESFGEGFADICRGLLDIANSAQNVRIIYPVHPNPNVKEIVTQKLGGHARIRLIEPLPYVAFVELMDLAKVLLTDSGGIQEEGPTLRKPIVVMREQTERPEGVQAGFAVLVGTDPARIRAETEKALTQGCRVNAPNPYGDGNSAQKILRALR
ncbi:MAG: non-hydrolyzing UDP-N-acetylglucosamine 2-epimerase [Bacteriovoracia bacterium]